MLQYKKYNFTFIFYTWQVTAEFELWNILLLENWERTQQKQ